MRRTRTVSWFLVIAVAVLACPGAGLRACYTIVVGRAASADGSVMVGHNEVNGGKRLMDLRVVPPMIDPSEHAPKATGGDATPPAPARYGFLWSENIGLSFSDVYMNEWGVSVVSNACRSRPGARGRIGYMLRRRVIQRARTAREGVRVAAELIARHGYSGSQTMLIADAREAWLMALTTGKHWVAQRVPDNHVALLPNVYITTEVNLADSSHFMSSPGLIEHAVAKGWHHPADGAFSFRECYGASPAGKVDTRQWRGQCLVLGRTIDKPTDTHLPFSVKPAAKVSLATMMAILRDRGPGRICGGNIQEACIFQLRSDMPRQVGCVYWRTTGSPDVSMFVPWYAGITATPEGYHLPGELREQLTLSHHMGPPASVFTPDSHRVGWTFMALQVALRGEHQDKLPTVRKRLDRFEATALADQAGIERKAIALLASDEAAGRAFLTRYSCDMGLKAAHVAKAVYASLEMPTATTRPAPRSARTGVDDKHKQGSVP